MQKYRITLSRTELRLILEHHLPDVKVTPALLDHLMDYIQSVIKGGTK